MDLGTRSASDFFFRTMTAYRATKVLLVANRLAIFEGLAGGPRTAAQVADALGCDRRAMTLLLRALVGMEVLLQADGRFSNSPMATDHLLPGKPGYVGDNLRFQDMLWECWSNLSQVVKTGKPWRSLPSLLADEDRAFTESYIRGMVPIAQAPAAELTRRLEQTPLRRVLDLGCGPGAFALAMLAARPELRATLFDLPSTLAVTRKLLAGSPCLDRIEFREGDYHRDEYGSGYDLVLMSHTTHDESPDAIAAMARRAFRSLVPGGTVAIHDWLVDEGGATPAFASLFGVNLMVYTDGQVYSEREYTSFLTGAGFGDVRTELLLAGQVGNPTGLVTARKPEEA